MRVQRGTGSVELAQGGADRATAGEVQREPATGEGGSPREAMALTDPDRGADRDYRPRVTEFVPGEAQGVQRRDLGFGLVLGAGEREGALSEFARCGGVGFDQIERGLGKRERILVASVSCHRARVSRRALPTLNAHRILLYRSSLRKDRQ